MRIREGHRIWTERLATRTHITNTVGSRRADGPVDRARTPQPNHVARRVRTRTDLTGISSLASGRCGGRSVGRFHRPGALAVVVRGLRAMTARTLLPMSIPTTAVARYEPALSDVERMTLLGYLAGYRGFTRDAYALDLRQFATRCWQHDHRLFDVRRVDIECFARDLEDRGKRVPRLPAGCARWSGATATPKKKMLGTRCVHIRRRDRLARNELGAFLVTAGLSSLRDHALVSLLALNGLRVSEAIDANIEALGQERGHRTLTVLRKGGNLVTMPLAPRVARAIDLAVDERLDGPMSIDIDGQRLDRHVAGRIVRRIAPRAEIGKRVGPHTLQHAFITAALDAGVPLRDAQEAASHADQRTTMRYDRGRQSLDRHATYIVATFVAGASR